MLQIDRRARTLAGIAVPWNVSALNHRALVGYRPDTLHWPMPWSLPLLLRHDQSLRAGRVIELDSHSQGLWAEILLSRSERGDRALELADAGWEFSIGINPATARFVEADGIRWCVAADLTEISIVPDPVYAGAPPKKES